MRGLALCLGFVLALSSAGCVQKRTLAPLEETVVPQQPETITLKITDYQPSSGKVFKNIFVSNFSVRASHAELRYSTARDGLSDPARAVESAKFGFGENLPDSNGDLFSDLFVMLTGIPVEKQGMLFCGDPMNSANDGLFYRDSRVLDALGHPLETFLGLRDCEKYMLQLDPQSFDFDRDGIPDYLELRNGLNPRNGADAELSLAGEGISNSEKVKRGIPVDESGATKANQLFAYNYKTLFGTNSRRSFEVSNIPVLLDAGRENLIAIYLIETDLASQVDALSTSFVIIKSGAAGKTFNFVHQPGSNLELVAP